MGRIEILAGVEARRRTVVRTGLVIARSHVDRSFGHVFALIVAVFPHIAVVDDRSGQTRIAVRIDGLVRRNRAVGIEVAVHQRARRSLLAEVGAHRQGNHRIERGPLLVQLDGGIVEDHFAVVLGGRGKEVFIGRNAVAGPLGQQAVGAVGALLVDELVADIGGLAHVVRNRIAGALHVLVHIHTRLEHHGGGFGDAAVVVGFQFVAGGQVADDLVEFAVQRTHHLRIGSAGDAARLFERNILQEEGNVAVEIGQTEIEECTDKADLRLHPGEPFGVHARHLVHEIHKDIAGLDTLEHPFPLAAEQSRVGRRLPHADRARVGIAALFVQVVAQGFVLPDLVVAEHLVVGHVEHHVRTFGRSPESLVGKLVGRLLIQIVAACEQHRSGGERHGDIF